MTKTYLSTSKRLLTRIAIAASISFALARKLLKAARHHKRSTKPADGLTLAAFDLACTKRITFREARQELEHSAVASEVKADGNRDHRLLPIRVLEATLNFLRPARG